MTCVCVCVQVRLFSDCATDLVSRLEKVHTHTHTHMNDRAIMLRHGHGP